MRATGGPPAWNPLVECGTGTRRSTSESVTRDVPILLGAPRGSAAVADVTGCPSGCPEGASSRGIGRVLWKDKKPRDGLELRNSLIVITDYGHRDHGGFGIVISDYGDVISG